jgi:hypothetical protein
MTIPIVGAQDAAAPLNGFSPTGSNTYLGFELMKMAGAAPRPVLDRHSTRGPHWPIVNPAEGPIDRRARRFCDARHLATAKSLKNA